MISTCDGCGGPVVRHGCRAQLDQMSATGFCRECGKTGTWAEGVPGEEMKMTIKRPMKVTIKRQAKVLHVIDKDGLTLCCRAMTTIYEDGIEYCKGCYEAVSNPGPQIRVEVGETMKLTVRIEGQRPRIVEVASFEEASKITRQMIEEADVGGSGFGGALLWEGPRKPIGHVSYNGRVWEGKPQEWTRQTKLLWQSEAEAKARSKSDG